MEILQNQISLNLEIESISLPEVFLVSRIAQRAKERAKTMPVTFGPKCFELFEKSDRATSWGKMFMDSLLGTADLFSMRCVLTWKLKVTPYGRLLFQLQPSTRRTEGIGFGLLPTPKAFDGMAEGAGVGKTLKKTKIGFVNIDRNGVRWGPSLNDIARNGMLPNQETGESSRLNPRFVAEMMGFPPNWTELPFQNGETKA